MVTFGTSKKEIGFLRTALQDCFKIHVNALWDIQNKDVEIEMLKTVI